MDEITVITPTYNRAHVIDRCYKSLCNQTNKNFYWLVIDDGSTDETTTLINKYKNEGKIKVEYLKKENGGKASALNIAIDTIKTKYCVCLDSDEYFSNDAIEIALNQLYSVDKRQEICGILALRSDAEGYVLGGKEIPDNVEKIKYVDIHNKYNINSEVICFYKTEILKRYRFPEFKGEKFVSPAYIQYEITQDYYFKVFRSRIIFCEYMDDGLTKNKISVIKKNPNGYLVVKKQSFKYATRIKYKIRHGIMYGAISILAKNKKFIQESPCKIYSILLLPFSYFVYLIKFRRKTR